MEVALAVLVIGGCGFVGLNLATRLAADGRPVVLFDTRPPDAATLALLAALPGAVRFVAGDVREPAGLMAVTAEVEAAAVVYGAALTAGPAREAETPVQILEVNLLGLVNALTAARAAGVRRVVNLSSVAAYGAAGLRHALLEEERTPEDPRALYPITKFAGERVASRLAELWGSDVASVRLSGVFGPFERPTGVRDTLSPQLQVIERLARGEAAILPRPGLRDWLYAPDAASAIVALMDAPALEHGLYNIGPGARWSVLDWGRLVALALGLPENRCRLAAPGEAPNVDFHGPGDRAPLAIDRLVAATGFSPAFDMAGSARDLAARWRPA